MSFGSIPALNSNVCFAAPGGLVTPLVINSSLSSQSGIFEFIYADGFDPNGVPTTLILNGFSANLYGPTNTDPNADQIDTNEWASGAAIGEDDAADGTSGVANDGTNTAIVFFYDVVGGACNNAGGPDAPFFFVHGKPVHHRHKRHPHHRNKPTPVRDRGRDRRR